MGHFLCLAFSAANDLDNALSKSHHSPVLSHFCSFTCIRDPGFPLFCLSKSHFFSKASSKWLICLEEFSCGGSLFLWAHRCYQLYHFSHYSSAIHQLAFVLLCCLFVVYDLCHFCVLLKQIWVISLIEIWGTRAAWLEIFCISIN